MTQNKREQYPWDEIRAKYEAGTHSLSDLAEKYGFHVSWGSRKAKEKGWVQGGMSKRVDDLARERMYESLEGLIDKKRELKAEYAMYIKWIRESIIHEVFDLPEEIHEDTLPDIKDGKTHLNKLERALDLLERTKEMDWSLFGIEDTPDKLDVNMNHSGEVVTNKEYDVTIIQELADNKEYRRKAEELYRIEQRTKDQTSS